MSAGPGCQKNLAMPLLALEGYIEAAKRDFVLMFCYKVELLDTKFRVFPLTTLILTS